MALPLKDQKTYIVESLTPRQDDPDFERKIELFGERYHRIIRHGGAMSIPDNPMGHLHFGALEVLEFLGVEIEPDGVLMHLNTFHRKEDLDALLRNAAERGVRNLLVVSGDGSPRLPRLDPSDLGAETKAVTSVELLGYIASAYPGTFRLGAAFNYSEPPEHEMPKLARKLEAGAEFVITQPVIGAEEHVARMVSSISRPVFIGAWMSPKIELIYECLGMTAPSGQAGAPPYSPVDNLRQLHEIYPAAGMFLSRLAMKADWSAILPRLAEAAPAQT